MSKTRLLRISRYAKLIEKTPTWVGKLIKDGKVETETIDGTIFIKTQL